MSDRPQMHDWGDACDYMEKLEAEIERLRAAHDEAVVTAAKWETRFYERTSAQKTAQGKPGDQTFEDELAAALVTVAPFTKTS